VPKLGPLALTCRLTRRPGHTSAGHVCGRLSSSALTRSAAQRTQPPVPAASSSPTTATDDLIGTVELKRRAADLPGHVTEDGEELELGYLLRPDAWGAGLAFEAATAHCARPPTNSRTSRSSS
jgi:hypothetical protein